MVLTDILEGIGFIASSVLLVSALMFVNASRYVDPKKRLRWKVVALIAIGMLLFVVFMVGLVILDDLFFVFGAMGGMLFIAVQLFDTILAIRAIPQPRQAEPPPQTLYADDDDEWLASLNVAKPPYRPQGDSTGE